MQYLDKPFNQVVFFVVISIFLSFSSNLVRKDSIPLLAKKLEITEDIDIDSDESTLLAISLDKAKEFFEQITTLENPNPDIRIESQKRLNRDLSE